MLPRADAEGPKHKLPVPDIAAQEEALATIHDVYKGDYKDKSSLAKKLIEKAKEEQDPTERFALLQEAQDLAAAAFQGALAFEAVDAMAREFAISSSEMKCAILEKAAKRPRLKAAQKTAIAAAALQVIDEAIAEDEFEAARKLSSQANQLARASKNKELLQDIVAKNRDVEAASKAYVEVKDAAAALKKKPDDPDANLAMGRYRCFTKGDWEKGLPMLALGSDEKLKTVAAKDIAGAASPAEQVKLGDAWWELSKERAAYWYRDALPELDGSEQERVAKRMSALRGTLIKSTTSN
jgi:hypothetical protein